MSSHDAIAGLDLEDLTPRQLRQLLRSAARRPLLRKEKEDEEKDVEDDDAAKENDDLVDLQEETKGKSSAPKVTKEDLPKGLNIDEDEEEDDEAPKKKGKK